MSIFDYEIASAYGAIDSAGIASGTPYHAHLLRTVAMNANRLTYKGEQLISMCWPTRDTGEFNGAPFEGIARVEWSPILGPIPIIKRSWSNRATARIYSKVASSTSIWLQFATQASPFDPRPPSQSRNTVEVTGTGSWKVTTVSDLVIQPGHAELLTVYVIAEFPSGKSSTGSPSPGTPNAGTWTTLTPSLVADSGATWQVPSVSVNNWAENGSFVSLEDSSGNVSSTREIVDVTSNSLYFDRDLSQEEINLAQAGGYYSIWPLTTFQIGCVAMASTARGF